MERYQSYKDSGVQWLEEIPRHWGIIRSKCLLKIQSNCTKRECKIGLENIEGFTGKFIKTSSAFEGDGVDFDKGDIVYGKLRPYLCKVWLAEFDGNAVGDFYVYKTSSSYFNAYAKYLMLSNPFTDICNASTYGAKMPRVSHQFISSLNFPLPPLSEQHSIVSYLDDKCAKIDKSIENMEKQIDLLQEMKQRVISDAVTRGLDKTVKMKKSGIAWLDEVPEHWEVSTLRKFLSMFSEKGHGDKQLLSVTREQGVIVRNTESKEDNHNFIPEDLSGYKYVQEGDFVINKMKSWQGSYGVSSYEGIVSPAYYTCKLQGVDKSYFSVAIRSKAYIPFFGQYSKGIRVDQWDLSPVSLKTIPFILPPIEEQRAIVSYINERTAKIETLAKKLEQEIEYLKEYKQRLISDVVTGQVKVC